MYVYNLLKMYIDYVEYIQFNSIQYVGEYVSFCVSLLNTVYKYI